MPEEKIGISWTEHTFNPTANGTFPTLTVADHSRLPPGTTIVVQIEHDDGYVSIASIEGCPYRCYVNTAERRAWWESRIIGADGWIAIHPDGVDLPQRTRDALHRAAAAGLVAAGLRS